MNINDNTKLTILIIAITLSEALGQYLLKLSTTSDKYYYLPFVTWLLYGVCTYLLMFTYNYTTMGSAELYWDALSAIVVPVIGIYAFNNKITMKGWFGILLIIVGILLTH